jgi:hypothetical protein
MWQFVQYCMHSEIALKEHIHSSFLVAVTSDNSVLQAKGISWPEGSEADSDFAPDFEPSKV